MRWQMNEMIKNVPYTAIAKRSRRGGQANRDMSGRLVDVATDGVGEEGKDEDGETEGGRVKLSSVEVSAAVLAEVDGGRFTVEQADDRPIRLFV
jgi:hypothetical protein